MLDVSFGELSLVVVVAFLILGPKELPTVIRAISRFMRQCREVIDECKAQLDGLAEESGIKNAKTYIKDESGQWRETYDISDIIAEREADAPGITDTTPESIEGSR